MAIKITAQNNWIYVYNNYAIKSNGELWPIRNTNQYSEIGGHSFENLDLPNNINVLKYFFSNKVELQQIEISAVSTNNPSYYAIGKDSSLWTWGPNAGFSSTIASKLPRKHEQSWSYASGGTNFVVVLRSDKSLWAWGNNSHGQLGQGDRIHRSSPVQVGVVWKMISQNYNHTLGIRSNGTLWSWGENAFGQLGQNDQIHRSSPVQIGTSSWNFVYAGYLYSAAIRFDGSLHMWGQNYYGSLGQSDQIHRSSPVQVGTSSWTTVCASSYHTLAIKIDGSLWSWGQNLSGELGHNTAFDTSSPVQIGTSSWSFVSSARFASTAIKADGTLWVWGSNFNGELGLGDRLNRSSPVQIGTSSWTSVKVSGQHSIFAIKKDGTLWSWGNNYNGELGLGDRLNRSSPVQIGSSWISVSGGDGFTVAIKSNGTLWSWGRNAQGQLGQGNLINRSSPVQVGTYYWDSIATGHPRFTGSSAIRSDGTLWAVGGNYYGSLGLGDLISKSSPVQVGSEINTWNYVAAGGGNVSAIKTDGTLWSWGNNLLGALGQNDTIHRSSPVQIGTSSWSQVSAGGYHSLAIKPDGTLWAWGYGGNGQLGQGNKVDQSSPVQVGVDSNWASAYARSIQYAIKTNGSLWGWGTNVLGIESYGYYAQPSPIQVATGNNWKYVDNTSENVFAIKTDGSLWSWGRNGNGQLGLGDRNHRSSPVQIGTSSWTAVSSDQFSTLAIKSDGSLWGWGGNSYGQLGQDDLIHRSSPVQIGTSSWSFVSTSGHSLAIKKDGTLWTWGNNSWGQLGHDDVINRSSPVQVGTSLWKYTSSAYAHSAAIKTDGTLWTWGRNLYGELAQGGDRILRHRSYPMQVGFDAWKSVKTGYTSIAVREDGTLWAWGYNVYGPLGQGDNVHRSSPVQVGTLSWNFGFTNRHFGSQAFSIGIRSDNTLWGWGSNDDSTLGIIDPLQEPRSYPVQISASSWSAVSVGFDNVFAIRSDGTLWAWGNHAGTNTVPIFPELKETLSPVQINSSYSWSFVSGGGNLLNPNTYAIQTDGSLWWCEPFGANVTYSLPPTLRKVSQKSYVILDAENQFFDGEDELNLILKSSGRTVTNPIEIGFDNIIDVSEGNIFKKVITNEGTYEFRIKNLKELRDVSYNFTVLLERRSNAIITFSTQLSNISWQNDVYPIFYDPPGFEPLKDRLVFTSINNVLYAKIDYNNLITPFHTGYEWGFNAY